MGFGNSIRNALNRKKYNLGDQAGRLEAIKDTIQAAKDKVAAGKSDISAVLKPIITLGQEFQKNEYDSLEVYARALHEFPNAQILKDALDARLQNTNRISEELLPYFVEILKKDIYNIALWRRVIDDFDFYRKPEKSARMKMLYIISIGKHFEDGKDSTWFDIETESIAEKKLQQHIEELLDNFDDKWASLDIAEDFSDTLAKVRPDDMRTAMIVAVVMAENGDTPKSALPLIEEALHIEPDRVSLKRALGLGLAKYQLEQRGQEAWDILYEIMMENEKDTEVLEALLEMKTKLDLSEQQRLDLLKNASEQNRKNLSLRVEYAKELARLRPEADGTLRLLTEVLAYAPSDPELIQLQAKVMIQQQNPIQAIAMLERMYLSGDDSKGTVSTLADCYASVKRRDKRARDVYLKSLKQGHGTKEILEIVGEMLIEKDMSSYEIETFEMMSKKHDATDTFAFRLATILKNKPEKRLQEIVKLSKNAPPDHKAIIAQLGYALAEEVTRSNVRMVLALPPKLSLKVFEIARKKAPDALILTTQLAKMKLEQGIRDEDTEELLSDICRRDSGEIDMRFERAKMAYEMGSYSKALSLFRELLDRQNSNQSSAFATNTPSNDPHDRETLISYMVDIIPKIEQPDEDDLDFFYRNLHAKDIDPEHVLVAAQQCLGNGVYHLGQQVLLEKALVYFPEDKIVHRNVAIVRLTNNNPAAFEEMCDVGFTDDELASAWKILRARLISIRKKQPDFILSVTTGKAMAQSLDSLPDYKRVEWQDVISEFCEK